jgi:hypothetical protein
MIYEEETLFHFDKRQPIIKRLSLKQYISRGTQGGGEWSRQDPAKKPVDLSKFIIPCVLCFFYFRSRLAHNPIFFIHHTRYRAQEVESWWDKFQPPLLIFIHPSCALHFSYLESMGKGK